MSWVGLVLLAVAGFLGLEHFTVTGRGAAGRESALAAAGGIGIVWLL